MLPDMSDTLSEWSLPYPLKTVTKLTVDFVEADTVSVGTVSAVIQVADKTKLNIDQIDWSLRYLLVHTADEIIIGQYIEFEGGDYKVVDDGNYQLYGFTEAVAEQTKRTLLEAAP